MIFEPDVWGNSIADRGKNNHKGPNPGSLLDIDKESKKANVAEVEWVRRKVRGDSGWGDTYVPVADSCQYMAKTTIIL